MNEVLALIPGLYHNDIITVPLVVILFLALIEFADVSCKIRLLVNWDYCFVSIATPMGDRSSLKHSFIVCCRFVHARCRIVTPDI